MSRELTDMLLSHADFGEHEVVADSGAESTFASGKTIISKPIFFKNDEDPESDSICLSMEIKINETVGTVEIEHPYIENIEELKELARKEIL